MAIHCRAAKNSLRGTISKNNKSKLEHQGDASKSMDARAVGNISSRWDVRNNWKHYATDNCMNSKTLKTVGSRQLRP